MLNKKKTHSHKNDIVSCIVQQFHEYIDIVQSTVLQFYK